MERLALQSLHMSCGPCHQFAIARFYKALTLRMAALHEAKVWPLRISSRTWIRRALPPSRVQDPDPSRLLRSTMPFRQVPNLRGESYLASLTNFDHRPAQSEVILRTPIR